MKKNGTCHGNGRGGETIDDLGSYIEDTGTATVQGRLGRPHTGDVCFVIGTRSEHDQNTRQMFRAALDIENLIIELIGVMMVPRWAQT